MINILELRDCARLYNNCKNLKNVQRSNNYTGGSEYLSMQISTAKKKLFKITENTETKKIQNNIFPSNIKATHKN